MERSARRDRRARRTVAVSVMQRPPTAPAASSTHAFAARGRRSGAPPRCRRRRRRRSRRRCRTAARPGPLSSAGPRRTPGPRQRGGSGEERSARQFGHGWRRPRHDGAGHCPILITPANRRDKSRSAPGINARREATMLDAAVKALAQMFSPPFRKVLLKSAGIALLLIVVAAIGLHRVLVWFAEGGQVWLQTHARPHHRRRRSRCCPGCSRSPPRSASSPARSS